MNLIFAAVDGTGPKDDVIYAEAFEHSFVRTIWRSCPTPFRFYWRGPNDLGFETKSLAERLRLHVKCSLDVWRAKQGVQKPVVLNLLNERVMSVPVSAAGAPPKICLAGYSRGAAAAIFAAKELAPLTIDYLIMFDAVDRSPNFTSAMKVPSNVKTVWHVRRDQAAGSREAFGNCGVEFDRATTKYHERCFLTTHGGAGGTPWCTDPTFKADFLNPDLNGSGKYSAKQSGRWREPVREIPSGSKTEAAVFYVNYVKSGFQTYPAARKTVIEALTNVTFAEDLKGSQAAWKWIAPQLQAEGLMTSSHWEGLAIQPL